MPPFRSILEGSYRREARKKRDSESEAAYRASLCHHRDNEVPREYEDLVAPSRNDRHHTPATLTEANSLWIAATSPAGKALADEGKVEGRGNTHRAAPGPATALQSAIADVEFRKLGVDRVLVGASRRQSEFPGRDEARAPRVPGV